MLYYSAQTKRVTEKERLRAIFVQKSAGVPLLIKEQNVMPAERTMGAYKEGGARFCACGSCRSWRWDIRAAPPWEVNGHMIYFCITKMPSSEGIFVFKAQDLISVFAPHFGQVTRSLPLFLGTRRSAPQPGHLKYLYVLRSLKRRHPCFIPAEMGENMRRNF